MNIAKQRDFLLQEIKIDKPLVSKDDIIFLYDKIDDYIQSNWRYEEEPGEDDLYVLELDKELDNIMEEYDPRFETGYNEIKYYLSDDPNKNKKLFQKLKNLDSKINYNI